MGDNFTSYPKNTLVVDVSFLVIATSILQIYIIKGLGFYSDDWVFLSMLHNSKDSSILGLINSLFAESMVVARPVFVMQLAILYKIFGLNPFGYHVANLIIIISEILFFYLSLRQMKLLRVIEIGLPTIYIFLPHYSTTHIWIACFNANLSMAFFFLNFYINFKILNSVKNNKFLFVLSLMSLTVSILSYEVVVPLFFINFLIIWVYSLKIQRYSKVGKLKIITLLIANLFTLILCVLFKIINTNRQGGFRSNYPMFRHSL